MGWDGGGGGGPGTETLGVGGGGPGTETLGVCVCVGGGAVCVRGRGGGGPVTETLGVGGGPVTATLGVGGPVTETFDTARSQCDTLEWPCWTPWDRVGHTRGCGVSDGCLVSWYGGTQCSRCGGIFFFIYIFFFFFFLGG